MQEFEKPNFIIVTLHSNRHRICNRTGWVGTQENTTIAEKDNSLPEEHNLDGIACDVLGLKQVNILDIQTFDRLLNELSV